MNRIIQFMLSLVVLVALTVQAGIPDQQLLEQLKSRLLEPAECLPSCATINSMEIKADTDQLGIKLNVHAQETVALPLPAKEGEWWPQGYAIDGERPAAILKDNKGVLWVLVPKGRHQISLSGRIAQRSQINLPLPLRPGRVVVNRQHWAVNGLDENGVPDHQLQLIRKQQVTGDSDTRPVLEPGVLPPLLGISRTLRLGLEWTVETNVRRLSPAGSPITIDVPLLETEAVTTAGIKVKDHRARVSLSAGQSDLYWQSKLTPGDQINLKAPSDPRWVEEWKLDVGPIWHVTLEGIPVVHHQDSTGAWLPTWSPWPGESARIEIERPSGVPGQTLTIDGSKLTTSPGQRATDTQLELIIRSSQGSQHQLLLPEDAVLQQIVIDGKPQPIRQENGQVTLPIHPGKQTVRLEWRTQDAMQFRLRSPAVDVGIPSVNHAIQINMGLDRWVLLAGGPLLGPAVLIWGVLLVILLLSSLLGQIRITPLRWYHWALLSIGLTQTHVFGALIIVGWLLAIGVRGQAKPVLSPTVHNVMQIGIALLTLLAVSALFEAIRNGLLGYPSMQIAGNGSTSSQLNWYQDQVDALLPTAWVISVPLLVYRLSMLAWALWLALALLRWIKWGWQAYSLHGLWREMPKRQWINKAKKDDGDKADQDAPTD